MIGTKQGLNLLSQLSKLIDRTGTTRNVINFLTVPPGTDYCNVYLLPGRQDALNFDKEFSLKFPRHDMAGSRQNFSHGSVDIASNEYLAGYQYLGFQNPSSVYEVNVSIEIVAIVNQEITDNKGFATTSKDRMFGECLKLLNYGVLTEDSHKMEICSCLTEDLTKKYTQYELREMPNYKATQIIGENIKMCAERIDDTKKYPEAKAADDVLENDVSPTRINLISKYKSNNCYFTLNYDGSMLIDWFNGQKTEGSWKIEGKFLICNYSNTEYRYSILVNKPRRMEYREMSKTNTLYSAQRIID